MTGKVRHVDFSADEWLGGTKRLSDAECGIYIRACALIYSHGGPITRADLRAVCSGRGVRFWGALDVLIQNGKLIAVDDEHLDQVRCETELARARRRIDAAKGNAEARWARDTTTGTQQEAQENNPKGLEDAPAMRRQKSPRKPSKSHDGHTTVTQPLHNGHGQSTRKRASTAKNKPLADAPAMLTSNQQSRSTNLGPYEPKFVLLDRACDAPPLPSQGDGAALLAPAEPGAAPTVFDDPALKADAIAALGRCLEVLRGKAGTLEAGAADPRLVQFRNRLYKLNALAGERLVGDARVAAWEVIGQAGALGNPDGLPAWMSTDLAAIEALAEAE